MFNVHLCNLLDTTVNERIPYLTDDYDIQLRILTSEGNEGMSLGASVRNT